MTKKHTLLTIIATFTLLLLPYSLFAQGTMEDYERAEELSDQFRGLVTDMMLGQPNWIHESNRFWYRKSVEDGEQFIWVNAETREQRSAFNQSRMASALEDLTGEEYEPYDLPFNSISYTEDEAAIEVTIRDSIYTCTLAGYQCEVRPEEDDNQGNSGWGQWDHEVTPVDRAQSDRRIESPDEEWVAYVQNYNVVIEHLETEETTVLSTDGSEGNYYNVNSFSWSPDSRKLAAYRVIPGYDRKIHYVESSPSEQLQPRHLSRSYNKPGDVLDVEQPVLFDIEEKSQIVIDRTLFPNSYDQTRLRWWEDGRAFHFEYNQRGHQLYRIIEVDAETGEPRVLVNEQPETFFSYATTRYREYLDETNEIIWSSERDGWRHLYLYDALTGEVKNQITSGEWVVRDIDHVDAGNRQIWFHASGVDDDQDPYYIHYFRVNFDGTGLTRFTEANGTHSVSYSPSREYYVDSWSQVDQPPVSQLRRVEGQEVLMDLERADHSALVDAGWQAPIQYSAKGRDGETDIYGIVIRPTNFDPTRSYPVIEYIYAGPHDSFVPKSFISYSHMMALSELGFIVVQIDGMGTANRSKEFHDVAWQNLKDAGFPDRILWHEAFASDNSWYDNNKVGIYGTSAGGQSSMGALLFHPEHYHVAVSAVGCHDNRMDKIWWNEQWMGWPIGEHYSESSNVDNAWRLQGQLLLIVGELDTNVDPASTYQVADALIDAGKDFDFLTIPGANHTSGGQYGERRRRDFFVKHLLDVTPPNWNMITANENGPEVARQ
ncbi:MAG: prolyl oligopeptidase family serine peptidase [Balneolaceae bacterium]